jgi:hypothetical protein
LPNYFSPPNVISLLPTALLPQGRLTFATGAPISTVVSAGANVFYTPYLGNQAPVWNGANFQATTFSELTNVLANSATGNAGPAAGAASKNYDMFVWNNGGTPTLTRGAAWNSDTVRSATTENDLQRVQGILVNLNAITNGPAVGFGTYVGTVRTDSGGATVSYILGGVSTAAVINFWNMYNRVSVITSSMDSTASWSYTSATVRGANNAVTTRTSIIRGLNEEQVSAVYAARVLTANAVDGFFDIGIGLDVTNAILSGSKRGLGLNHIATGSSGFPLLASYNGLPGLGFHFIQAVEAGDGTNATTVSANGTDQELSVSLRA